MPRNSEGTYQKAAPSVVTGTTIASDVFNDTIDDLVTDANSPRPIVAGGTSGTSVATAQAALGVAQKQSSVGDSTAGRGMIVGAFGLGSNAFDESNFNDPTDRTQFVRTPTTSTTGAPDTQNVWNGMHFRKDSTAGWMMLANTEDTELRVRMETGAAWAANWLHVPILYSVTSNSNGVSWRFSDGRQVCIFQTDTLASTTANGNLFISSTSTWTFPENFSATTRLFVTGSIRASVIGGFHLESAPATTSCEWRRWTSTSSAATPVIVLRAEGTWR